MHAHMCVHVCACICIVAEALSGSVQCELSSLGLLQTVYDVPLRQLPMISCSEGSRAWEQWNKVEGNKLLKVQNPQMSPSVIHPVTCTCAIPLSFRDLFPTQPFSACFHCFQKV